MQANQAILAKQFSSAGTFFGGTFHGDAPLVVNNKITAILYLRLLFTYLVGMGDKGQEARM